MFQQKVVGSRPWRDEERCEEGYVAALFSERDSAVQVSDENCMTY